MPAPSIPEREFEPPEPSKFRILAIDGGGIRGLIPAMLLTKLEELIAARTPAPRSPPASA